MSAPVSLEVKDLVKHFPVHGGLLRRRKGVVKAVDGVSFAIARAETLGPRRRVGLRQDHGQPDGAQADRADRGPHPAQRHGRDRVCRAAQMWQHRRNVQIVFQDPYSSLNPRMSAGAIVGEPLSNFGIASGAEKERARRRTVRACRAAAGSR